MGPETVIWIVVIFVMLLVADIFVMNVILNRKKTELTEKLRKTHKEEVAVLTGASI